MLQSHASEPFNPDIARVFYCAGYIESRERGIQKICDACKSIGADEPVYIIHGEDILVKFCALQSAIVSESSSPKGHDEPLDEPLNKPLDELLDESLEEKILVLMRKTPNCTYDALAESIGVSRSTVKRAIKLLENQGKIKRIGGGRYGHWEIHEWNRKH